MKFVLVFLWGVILPLCASQNNVSPRSCKDKGSNENVTFNIYQGFPVFSIIFNVIFYFSFLATLSKRYLSDLKYSNFKVLRIEPSTNPSAWKKFDFHNFLPWNEQSMTRGYVDILVRPDNVDTVTERLKSNNLTYRVLIDNVQELFNITKMSSLFRSPLNQEGHRMTWDKFHGNEDINNYLEFLARNRSDIVSLENIGYSYEGRRMKVLKVCKGGCGLKPAMWIDGGIHAREWISPATVTFLIRKLLGSHDTELIDKLDWYFLPVLNPDGKISILNIK